MNPLARLMERMRRPATGKAMPAPRAPRRRRPAGRMRSENERPGRRAAGQRGTSRHVSLSAAAPAYPQVALSLRAAAVAAAAPAPQFQPPAAAAPAQQFQHAQPAYPPQYAQPQQYPPHFAPQPAAYPYPPAQPPQPAFHAWQAQPVAFDVYGRPQPVAAPYPPYPTNAPQAPARRTRRRSPPMRRSRIPLRPRHASVADRGGARKPARIP